MQDAGRRRRGGRGEELAQPRPGRAQLVRAVPPPPGPRPAAMAPSPRPPKRRRPTLARRAHPPTPPQQCPPPAPAGVDGAAAAPMSADDFLSGGFLRVGAKRRKGQAAARPADQPGADQAAGEGPGRTSEAAEHRAQLEALKDADPEFYAYLQQTDADLLRFEEVEDEEEQDDGPATKQVHTRNTSVFSDQRRRRAWVVSLLDTSGERR